MPSHLLPWGIFLWALLLCCAPWSAGGIEYPDLPTPNRTPNMVTYPVGSWIIEMGERQVASKNGLFNLYAYGLVIRLLYGLDNDPSTSVPVDWAIASNKAAGGVDFSAKVKRWHPTTSSSSTLSFKGGPFIVHASQVAKAEAILADWKAHPNTKPADVNVNFYSASSLINDLVIYKLDEETSIDIRHKIRIKPAIFLSGLETNEPSTEHQENILLAAGLERDVHYVLGETLDELENLFDASTCHTVFTEPHYNWNSDESEGRAEAAPGYKNATEEFVRSGGNFFAQCASVPSYENSGWPSQYTWPGAGKDEGAFLTKHGIRAFGNTGNEWGGLSTRTSMTYPNPDLPISQFVGEVSGNEPGTVSEFMLFRPPGSSETEAELWKNNGHGIVRNTQTGSSLNQQGKSTSYPNLLYPSFNTFVPMPSGFSAYIIAGAKVGDMQVGGMVYYSGSHSWWYSYNGGSSSSTPSGRQEYASQYNGRRIFLNAMLLPATRPASCGLNLCPDGEACPSAPLLEPCQQCQCKDDLEVITELSTEVCCRDDSHCPSDTECWDYSCNKATGECVIADKGCAQESTQCWEYECVEGSCQRQDFEDPCPAAKECWDYACDEDGTCQPQPFADPCDEDTDCWTWGCDANGACQKTLVANPCDEDTDCWTWGCDEDGECVKTNVADPCDEDTDCWTWGCDVNGACKKTMWQTLVMRTQNVGLGAVMPVEHARRQMWSTLVMRTQIAGHGAVMSTEHARRPSWPILVMRTRIDGHGAAMPTELLEDHRQLDVDTIAGHSCDANERKKIGCGQPRGEDTTVVVVMPT
ncbi:DNRLRE domain-containing protein [Balamuthia mandrillaris]